MRRIFSLAALACAVPFFAAAAQAGLGRDVDTWRWDGKVEAGSWMRIYNMNGSVDVTSSPDNQVHVVAEKNSTRGDRRDVSFEVVQGSGGNITICAIFYENTRCEEDHYSSHNNDNERNRVTVSFRVQIPRGVKSGAFTVNGAVSVLGATSEVNATTVNGAVEVTDVGGPVKARTVNGDVTVNAVNGPVSANTVNGSVNVSIKKLVTSDDMTFTTVNGSVRIDLPRDFDADVTFDTMNGGISSDFPVQLSGRFGPRHARGTIGKGGRELRARTVNGSISLRSI